MTSHTVHLRPTVSADLPFVISAEQHPDNAPYVDQWSKEQHESAIASPDYGHFIIGPVSDKASAGSAPTAIGYVIVSGLQDQNQVLLLKRIVITQKGQGYGRQAIQLTKAFAFNQLGFHRLWMDVVASNQRARSLYLSEGFVIEGTLREAYKTDNGYEDMFILSVLSSEIS